MRKLLIVLEKAEKILIILAYVIMAVVIFVQVLNRNIFHISVGWFEELARYCMIVVIMFSAEAGFRGNEHMRLQFFTDRLKGKPKLLLEKFVGLLIVLFSGIIAGGAWLLVKTVAGSGQRSPGLRIPMEIPYLSILIPFSVIAVVQLLKLFILSKDEKEDEGNKISEKGAENR